MPRLRLHRLQARLHTRLPPPTHTHTHTTLHTSLSTTLCIRLRTRLRTKLHTRLRRRPQKKAAHKAANNIAHKPLVFFHWGGIRGRGGKHSTKPDKIETKHTSKKEKQTLHPYTNIPKWQHQQKRGNKNKRTKKRGKSRAKQIRKHRYNLSGS